MGCLSTVLLLVRLLHSCHLLLLLLTDQVSCKLLSTQHQLVWMLLGLLLTTVVRVGLLCCGSLSCSCSCYACLTPAQGCTGSCMCSCHCWWLCSVCCTMLLLLPLQVASAIGNSCRSCKAAIILGQDVSSIAARLLLLVVTHLF